MQRTRTFAVNATFFREWEVAEHVTITTLLCNCVFIMTCCRSQTHSHVVAIVATILIKN